MERFPTHLLSEHHGNTNFDMQIYHFYRAAPKGILTFFPETKNCVNCRAQIIVLIVFLGGISIKLCLFFIPRWGGMCSDQRRSSLIVRWCAAAHPLNWKPSPVSPVASLNKFNQRGSHASFCCLFCFRLAPGKTFQAPQILQKQLWKPPHAMDHLCPDKGTSRTQALIGKL